MTTSNEERPFRTVTLIALAAWALGCGGCAGTQKPATSPDSGGAGEGSGAVVLGVGSAVKKAPPAPPMRVNQHGYLPGYPKFAVVVHVAKEPQKWELIDEQGKVLLSGQTVVKGTDADSGDPVHQIDFSAYKTEGTNLKVRVGGEQSMPFDIRKDLYSQLKKDALWYFYHNRSGIPIEMPWAGEEKWTRPAGHLSDKEVPCHLDAKCDYTLDVSGGWYDAGDHGKYVVNGGIAVWTVLNQYERMKHLKPASLEDYGDGKLRVPEQGNRVPDLLDEARWELEFLLKMQVPAGKPNAGMAHHKMHDEAWTAIGTKPATNTADIKVKRSLKPVSTAATLNLAAAAAQGARVFKGIDPAFSAKCLAAAETAWQAAKKNPKVLADPKDNQKGGGPYDDQRLDDEFYWAATELFITTGKPDYKQAMLTSSFHNRLPAGSEQDGSGPQTLFTWQSVSGAGTTSLAIVPSKASKADVQGARQAIIKAADGYLKLRDGEGYRVPFHSHQGKYPWGSNSFIINNLLALGLAHDFTGDERYVVGVLDGMNYLLGLNAMGFSYISGYGDSSLTNPHHRFWAKQSVDTAPGPIPGCLSGGPNSGLQDPLVNSAGLPGCKPQKCYLDHIDAWSVNEITINWNSPLAWVAGFLDGVAK